MTVSTNIHQHVSRCSASLYLRASVSPSFYMSGSWFLRLTVGLSLSLSLSRALSVSHRRTVSLSPCRSACHCLSSPLRLRTSRSLSLDNSVPASLSIISNRLCLALSLSLSIYCTLSPRESVSRSARCYACLSCTPALWFSISLAIWLSGYLAHSLSCSIAILPCAS